MVSALTSGFVWYFLAFAKWTPSFAVVHEVPLHLYVVLTEVDRLHRGGCNGTGDKECDKKSDCQNNGACTLIFMPNETTPSNFSSALRRVVYHKTAK